MRHGAKKGVNSRCTRNTGLRSGSRESCIRLNSPCIQKVVGWLMTNRLEVSTEWQGRVGSSLLETIYLTATRIEESHDFGPERHGPFAHRRLIAVPPSHHPWVKRSEACRAGEPRLCKRGSHAVGLIWVPQVDGCRRRSSFGQNLRLLPGNSSSNQQGIGSRTRKLHGTVSHDKQAASRVEAVEAVSTSIGAVDRTGALLGWIG
jgi:hypothetical protein